MTRRTKSPSLVATTRFRLAAGSSSKTYSPEHSRILLLFVVLMATKAITMARATTAAGHLGREVSRFRRTSYTEASSGSIHQSSLTNQKRLKNRNRDVRTFSDVSSQKPRGSIAAFVRYASRRTCVGAHTLNPSLPIMMSQSSLESRMIPVCSRKTKGNSALFSTTSEDAPETPPTQAQKTLAKQPLDDSIEPSIFDDSEHHVYESEQTIKKSRFIGLARYADDWKDASNFVQHIRNNIHPKARHWCFAYRGSIVDNDEIEDQISSGAFATSTTITERASDDGEPSGTAGQPILNALTTETTAPDGLIDAVVVVVRYSGGIKLGAGGLIRAYGGTARMVLQEHSEHQIEVIPKQKLSLSNIQPKHVGVVYDLAAKHGATVVATNDDYTSFSVTCDSEVAEIFKEGMMDATRGSAVIR